jgi:drug/metabolite transporter (DMT)-like permease
MSLLGVLLALTSAAVWGSGDFAGGLAARRSHHFQVLLLSAFSGIVLLVFLSMVRGEAPLMSNLTWAVLAGMASALGIASLYQGLAIGNAAIVASTSAVVTGLLPTVFGALTLGLPRPSQLFGFVLAMIGIGLVTRTSADAGKSVGASANGLKLGILAGIGFGGFLTLIAHIEGNLIFLPLVVARTTTLVIAVLVMMVRGISLPSLTSNHTALVAGLLDAGGNIFYVLSKQHLRLDIAAVLSSLYPVATVALARFAQHQQVTRMQWIGMGICMTSVALIAGF